MNDRDAAKRLVGLLDQALRDLDGRVAGELRARRQRALSGEGVARTQPGGALVWGLGHARGLLSALAAGGLALALLAWWPGQQGGSPDEADMELRLLTDDLPPDAYLDAEFPAWRRSPGLCRS